MTIQLMGAPPTPQGYTARGRTHQGGFYSDAECIQSISPPVTGQPSTGQPVTFQPVTSQPVTGHPGTSLLGTGQPGTGQFLTGQPGTGQPVTSLRSSSHSVITRHRAVTHQVPVTGHPVTRQQSIHTSDD